MPATALSFIVGIILFCAGTSDGLLAGGIVAVVGLALAMVSAPRNSEWAERILGAHTPVDNGPTPEPDDPHRRLRIIAVLVNTPGPAPERETVTLLNPGPAAIDLDGWALVGRLGKRMRLDPATLLPGEAVRISLAAPLQLGRLGGILTLLDPAGVEVDEVSYTAEQASTDGTTIVF